jgi:hypothetical protein
MASGSPVIIKFRANQIEPGGFCQWANVSFNQWRIGRKEKVNKHEVPEGAAPRILTCSG